MKKIDIYIKSLVLLNRENKLAKSNSFDYSSELIKEALFINNDKKIMSGDTQTSLDEFKNFILNYSENMDNYDDEMIYNSCSLMLKDFQDSIEIIKSSLSQKLDENELKVSVVKLRNLITTYIKETKLEKLITEASKNIRSNNLLGKTKSQIVLELITQLEANVSKGTDDKGLVAELDFNDDNAMVKAIVDVKAKADGTTLMKTGWKNLNKILKGGFKRPECVLVNALVHNYKSGFTRSVFMQLALHNTPALDDPTKKPLMVLISLEDSITTSLEFMFTYLYYNEHKIKPDINDFTTTEIASYINKRLSVNGYNIKLVRANPSVWTYRNIFNKVLEYEAQGYEIHALFVDYLGKLNTEGCLKSTIGEDKRDLWSRIYDFTSAHKILFLSPWQLSPKAQEIERGGLRGLRLLNEIEQKGYTEDSSKIAQTVDTELYISTSEYREKRKHLAVKLGKCRSEPKSDNREDSFVLPFIPDIPIPEDLNKDDSNEDVIELKFDDFDI